MDSAKRQELKKECRQIVNTVLKREIKNFSHPAVTVKHTKDAIKLIYKNYEPEEIDLYSGFRNLAIGELVRFQFGASIENGAIWDIFDKLELSYVKPLENRIYTNAFTWSFSYGDSIETRSMILFERIKKELLEPSIRILIGDINLIDDILSGKVDGIFHPLTTILILCHIHGYDDEAMDSIVQKALSEWGKKYRRQTDATQRKIDELRSKLRFSNPAICSS